MTRLPRTTCRNCRGSGATSYHGHAVLCPSCLGSGRRFPEVGDPVWSGHDLPIGYLHWRYLEGDGDGGTELYVALHTPEDNHRLLPTIEEVDVAEREDASPCQSE